MIGWLGSMAYTKLTGKKTKSYDPLDMWNWQFGGLFIGSLQDLGETMFNLYQAVLGDKENQNRYLSLLGRDISGIARGFIPWFQTAIQLFETAIDKEYIDTAFIRQLEAKIVENYTPKEIETLNRSNWEKFQHALWGGRQLNEDENLINKESIKIADKYKLVGTLDDKGKVYTLANFGSDVRAMEKKVPGGTIAEQYGFNDLILFCIDTEDYLDTYYYEPYEEYTASAKGKFHTALREQNPDLDAQGYFWGYWDTLKTNEARANVNSLYEYYAVPYGARR